jgi:acyl-CoA thioesterase-1
LNRLAVLFFLLAALSCGRDARPDREGARNDVSNEVSAVPAPFAPHAPPQVPRIVVLGDSLTDGLGLDRTEAYPALLERRVKEKGYPFEVVNAGVSGDTSADGLRRLDLALEGDVQILIVALGANDGLRGLPAAQMKDNLRRIIIHVRQRGIAALLVGMEAPPNFGDQYTKEFRAVFRDLAAESHVAFVPFLLEGVAGVPALNQDDRLHPTAAGAARIADTLWPALEKIIQTGRTR